MTTLTQRERNIDASSVNLGGRVFPIEGRVMRSLFSQQPPKVAPADIGVESNPITSTFVFGDTLDGIGVETVGGAERETSSVWYSNMSLRHRDHLVLQNEVTTTAQATAANVNNIAEHGGTIFADHGGTVFEYSTSADSWSSSNALTQNSTDALTVFLNGSETMVFATGTDVEYRIGTTWAANTGQDIEFLTFWRDLLWGLDSSGHLFFTRNLAKAWTATNAQVMEPAGRITAFLRGPEPSGDPEDALYVAAQTGLFIYDNENETFLATRLAQPSIPFHKDNGKGTVAWRESIYFPGGQSLYRFTPASVSQIDLVGPDRRDGLPKKFSGSITTMVAAHNDLLVGLDASGSTGTNARSIFGTGGLGLTGGRSTHRNFVFDSVLTGVGPIFGFNARSWEVKWDAGTAGTAIDDLFISNAYSTYRLWWGHNKRVFFMPIATDIINPRQVPNQTYTDSGFVDYPFFGLESIPKTALQFRLETQDTNDSNTVQIQYALDFDDSDSAFVTLGTQTKNGEVKYPLPTADNRTGVAFDSIRPRLNAKRGTLATSSPDVIKLSLDYLKEMDALWSFQFRVNATNDAYGRTAREKRDFIKGTVGKRGLTDFTYRDEANNLENSWVKLLQVRSVETTGNVDNFLFDVFVAEAVSA